MRLLTQWFRRDPLTTAESGRAAQRYADRLLRRKGYKIVFRNLSDSNGELDLVARHAAFDGIIVIEVRSCSKNTPLRQEGVFPESKMQQVVQTARRILGKKRLAQQGLRFDALIVTLDSESGRPKGMQHYENAFTANRRDYF